MQATSYEGSSELVAGIAGLLGTQGPEEKRHA